MDEVYGRIRLAVDIVVQRGHEFLFIRRRFDPFKDCLALPGGFVENDETVEAATCRELAEETGIQVQASNLRLIGVFSDPGRDPRGRVVSVAFYVLVPWRTEAKAGDDAKSLKWQRRRSNEPLAFDHLQILEAAL